VSGGDRAARRWVLVGCPGSGKSTLARRLGARCGIPVYHLDDVYWARGWRRPTDAEWEARVRALLALEEWVLDGTFLKAPGESRSWDGLFAARLAAADTVVFLDLPVRTCLVRVVRRYFRQRLGWERSLLPLACREPRGRPLVDRELLVLLRTVLMFGRAVRPRILEGLARVAGRVRVVLIKGDGDARRLFSATAREADQWAALP
jgi:adenylate kinase family enzyme